MKRILRLGAVALASSIAMPLAVAQHSWPAGGGQVSSGAMQGSPSQPGPWGLYGEFRTPDSPRVIERDTTRSEASAEQREAAASAPAIGAGRTEVQVERPPDATPASTTRAR